MAATLRRKQNNLRRPLFRLLCASVQPTSKVEDILLPSVKCRYTTYHGVTDHTVQRALRRSAVIQLFSEHSESAHQRQQDGLPIANCQASMYRAGPMYLRDLLARPILEETVDFSARERNRTSCLHREAIYTIDWSIQWTLNRAAKSPCFPKATGKL